MSQITVQDGGLVSKHPLAQLVYEFDYDAENLDAAVTIITSTMTLTVVKGQNTVTPAVLDNAAISAGNRKTSFRLTAGVSGTTYRVRNEATTSESPAQVKVKYIDILVQ